MVVSIFSFDGFVGDDQGLTSRTGIRGRSRWRVFALRANEEWFERKASSAKLVHRYLVVCVPVAYGCECTNSEFWERNGLGSYPPLSILLGFCFWKRGLHTLMTELWSANTYFLGHTHWISPVLPRSYTVLVPFFNLTILPNRPFQGRALFFRKTAQFPALHLQPVRKGGQEWFHNLGTYWIRTHETLLLLGRFCGSDSHSWKTKHGMGSADTQL